MVLTTIAEVREAVAGVRRSGGSVALVPTMGALHEGHLAHVVRARALADFVIVSIFVNPLQFGAGEDLDRYPRTLDADVAALAGPGADAVFAPSAAEMYPSGAPEVSVSAGAVGGTFEGAARPGHFDGVLTVVAKLFNIVEPDVATFGRKDAQQLALVQRMARELSFRTAVEPIEIVREADGLARSSRNRYLSAEERAAAAAVPRALDAGAAAADGGRDAVVAAVRAVLVAEPLVAEPDYVDVVDPVTFAPVGPDFRGEALVIVAVRVGSPRLLDNRAVVLG